MDNPMSQPEVCSFGSSNILTMSAKVEEAFFKKVDQTFFCMAVIQAFMEPRCLAFPVLYSTW